MADPDPENPGHWLVPAFATVEEPPAAGPRQAAVFRSGEWSLVPDWRGVRLYAPGIAPVPTTLIDRIGVTPGELGYTQDPPPEVGEHEVAVLDGGAWSTLPDWRDVPLWLKESAQRAPALDLGAVPDWSLVTELPPPATPVKYEGQGWVADLLAIQGTKWLEIKAERDRRMNEGGVMVGIHWFHTDAISRVKMTGLMLMGDNFFPPKLRWKTMTGVFVDMDLSLAKQIIAATAMSDDAIFQVAEEHRAAMEASPDPASYDISGGWPPVYLEKVTRGD